MECALIAIGRWRASPEKALYDDYADRIAKMGRPVALGPLTLAEFEPRKSANAALAAETALLANALKTRSGPLVGLDPKGKPFTTEAFSQQLTTWRDQGHSAVNFVIGGAEGLSRETKRSMTFSLSLGAMTWPHFLVRPLLAEQIYRAICIQTGHPYHRGKSH